MGIVRGGLWGSQKVIDITYAAIGENLLTPSDVPTTEPTDPQFSYTVDGAHLPTFSLSFAAFIYILWLWVGGKNTTGGAITLYWRMVKWVSGAWSNVYTSSQSIPANNYYTLQACFYNIAAGEQYGIKLWASATGINYDYNVRDIAFTRPRWRQGKVHGIFAFTFAWRPTLSQGSPAVVGQRVTSFYDFSETYECMRLGTVTSYSFSYFPEQQSYFFRIQQGDVYSQNQTTIYTHATYRPYYLQQQQPTKIRIRTLRKAIML